MDNTTFGLQQEIENARILREQLVAAFGDDDDLVRDTIEGETNLIEMIAKMVAADGEDEAMIEGIKAYEQKIKDRRERIQNRKDMRRALLATALEMSGRKKMETPAGTISLRNVPPSVVITEEADIPTQFWKAQTPKLDKKALLDALKAGEQIKGATLSNGSTTTSISR